MKKGFTLIELLAVIVILAIIALIATPIILGIIEDARKGSIEASANGYIDAVEYKIASNEIKKEEIIDGIYDVNDLEIDLDGSKPTYGEVIIEKGNVKEAVLCVDGFIVEFTKNKSIVKNACSSSYEELILNGADPVLKDELVPVNIASNGKITKADTSKEWYNYSNKKWANAVILFGEDNYKIGDLIDEADIKEYYVWIPRYAYKLWNVNGDTKEGSEKPIEIVFGSKASTTGENNGDMYLHPAFTNFNTQGIWVGKFEVSYNEETYTDETKFLSTNPNYIDATDSSELIIKPNVRSLASKTISEFHTLIYNSHRNLNSHMITNMEWGAIAYLSYSIYGRCDSETCTEVINNNVNTGWYGTTKLYSGQLQWGTTITGCAATNSDDITNSLRNFDNINRYNTEKGYLASTTGNITGIYDMSGGDIEYVMGVLVQPDGTLFSGRNTLVNSGFKGIYSCPTCNDITSGITENTEGIDFPNSKYYNIYKNNYELGSNVWYDYSQGMLGDATKEVSIKKEEASEEADGLWFNDFVWFPNGQDPWFVRGGRWHSSVGSGLFTSYQGSGGTFTSNSTRAVLAF